MKRLVITFILLLTAAEAAYGEVQEGFIRSLAIKDAIMVAIMNNRSVQVQEEEIGFARADMLYAKSAFLPKVDAGFGYTYTDSLPPTSFYPPSKKDPGIYTGYQNDNSFTIAVNETIYNGGADIAALEQSKLNLKVQHETLRATKLEVEFETKRLFYGILLAYETKRIAEDLVVQARAHYEEVKAMFGQGTASKFDVLQSSVQVSRLIPQLVNANNAVELLMADFKKFLSLNIRDPLKIDGELTYKLVDIKEGEFLQYAYQHNPRMVLKLLGIDMDRWGIEFAKAGWLPQVTANAAYTYKSNDVGDMFNSRHDNWNVGVRASIMIFDGFATKAKVDEARARYAQARIKKDDFIDQIAVDVTTACLNLQEAKAIIDSQKDSIVEAKEALRLSEVRFNNGVGINLDVLDAQVALAQVEQSLAQGIYDYIMAKAQLDRTMGREFFQEENYENRPQQENP